MSKKIKINVIENVIVSKVRESVEIELDDYPELRDLTESECVEYLKNNIQNMKPPKGLRYLDNLLESLNEQEICKHFSKDANLEINVNLYEC